MTSVSITGCGLYFPRYRLPAKEMAKAWGSCSARLTAKAVPAFDEDALTMGIAAARAALEGQGPAAAASGTAQPPPGVVGVLALASTTLPYRTKHVAAAAATSLSLGSDCFPLEFGQSARSGTEALIATASYMLATGVETGVVIAADAPAARPSDPLDHGLGAGACALLLSSKLPGLLVEGWASFSAEHLGQRFRPDGADHLRDIGVPGLAQQNYQRCVLAAVKNLLRKTGRTPADYEGLLIHDVDGRSGSALGRPLGFGAGQVSTAWEDLYRQVGDLGAASPLAALAFMLAGRAGAGGSGRWLVCSYGAGSCSDALDLVIPSTWSPTAVAGSGSLADQTTIDYTQYLKLRRAI